jgi:hypothetical protein
MNMGTKFNAEIAGKLFWASCSVEITFLSASASMLITYYGAPAIEDQEVAK